MLGTRALNLVLLEGMAGVKNAKDGHDLLIDLNSVYSVSLRQQLQDVGKKLVGAHHYNKDGSVNTRQDLDYYILYTFSDFSEVRLFQLFFAIQVLF